MDVSNISYNSQNSLNSEPWTPEHKFTFCYLSMCECNGRNYLDIRSAHGYVWSVERKRETGMAASSTICSVERSRTSESQFARMRDLASIKTHSDSWNGRFFEWVNRRARSKVSLQLEGETDGRKEGKAQDTRNRNVWVNMPKTQETDLPDPLQHSDTAWSLYQETGVVGGGLKYHWCTCVMRSKGYKYKPMHLKSITIKMSATNSG